MTAIEWLIQQIDNEDMGEIPMWVYDYCYDALEMEKQQNENEFERGFLKCADTLQFILDKGLLNNYNNENNDNGSYQPISRTKRRSA